MNGHYLCENCGATHYGTHPIICPNYQEEELTPQKKLKEIKDRYFQTLPKLPEDYEWLIARVEQLEEALTTLKVAVNDKQPDPGAVGFILNVLNSGPKPE